MSDTGAAMGSVRDVARCKLCLGLMDPAHRGLGALVGFLQVFLDIIGKLFLLEGGAGALLLLSIHAGCPGHLVSLLGYPFGSHPTIPLFIVLLGRLG